MRASGRNSRVQSGSPSMMPCGVAMMPGSCAKSSTNSPLAVATRMLRCLAAPLRSSTILHCVDRSAVISISTRAPPRETADRCRQQAFDPQPQHQRHDMGQDVVGDRQGRVIALHLAMPDFPRRVAPRDLDRLMVPWMRGQAMRTRRRSGRTETRCWPQASWHCGPRRSTRRCTSCSPIATGFSTSVGSFAPSVSDAAATMVAGAVCNDRRQEIRS